MDLLRRLKISEDGPIAKAITPATTHTITPPIKRSAEPTSVSSTSKLKDPVAGPSTPRLPPPVLPRTPSEVNVDEWSDHYWVLGRKHYQEAQVKADRSLSSVFEDEEPRFVSPIKFAR